MKEKSNIEARRGRARARHRQSCASVEFTELAERISDGFVVFDTHMNYTYVNQRGAELLGRKPEDLIGRNYWEEFPEARGTPFANAYVRALETQTSVMIEEYYAPWDRWFENRIYPSRDGISILFTEITERKKGEAAVSQQNRFISVLAETIPGFVYIYDWQTDSNVYMNKGLESMLGYTSEEVKAMGTKIFATLFNPDDAPAVIASQQRLASAGEQDVLEIDYRMRHSRGDWRWLRSYERPFAWNSDGSLKQKIGIAIDITERRNAEEQVQQQVKRLKALRMIDIGISSNSDLQVILNIVLQYTMSQLGADASAVLLFKSRLQTVEYAASRGFRSSDILHTQLKLSDVYAQRVVSERRTIHLADFMKTEEKPAQVQQIANEGFADYYGAPLIVKGEIKGVLEMYHRAPFNLGTEQLEFFETLAGQAAIAVDNAQLFSSLQQAHNNLIMAYDATIAGWSRAMDLRDQDSQGHAQRVTNLTLKLARAMGVGDAQLVHIRRGALLHDIGKIAVPDTILLKTEPLTQEEWQKMSRHPEFAYELLSSIGYLQPALDIPYCHHENWDGTGYPRGLKGEEIPLSARIFAVADVWDMITSDQPNRNGMPRDEALEYIQGQSGKAFDPQVVQKFISLFSA